MNAKQLTLGAAVAALFTLPLIALPIAASADSVPTAEQHAPHAGKMDHHGERMLKRFDKDGDGVISRAEAEGSPLAKHFDKIDTDGDGKITAAERQAMREKFQEHRQARHAEHFKRADTDADGAISRQEFLGEASQRFEAMDENKDSKLSPEELRPMRRTMMPRGEHDHHGQHHMPM